MQTLCFRIDPLALPADDATVAATAARWLDFWAAWPHPTRLLSRLVPQRYDVRRQAVQHAARALATGRQDDRAWRWRWLLQQRGFYDDLHRAGHALMAEHYLLSWVPDDLDPTAVQARIERCFGTLAMPCMLPPFWQHPVTERLQHLPPVHAGDPYLQVVTAHDVQGRWHPLSWQALLHLDVPLALAIDVRTPAKGGYRGTSRKTADAEEALEVIAEKQPHDRRARKAHAAASEALDVIDQQYIHQLSYSLLLTAPSLRALTQVRQAMEGALGARLHLVALPGMQAEQLKLFTATPRREIRTHLPATPTLSSGVAHKTPFGIKREAGDRGILLGTDLESGLLIHHDLLRPKENKHLVALGQPKYGKTTLFAAMSTRVAAEDAQVIGMEPLGKASLVRDMVGSEWGCRYVEVAKDLAINLLDPISVHADEQLAKVIRGIEIALGHLVWQGGRQTVEPRMLSEIERSLIDRAVHDDRVYGTGCHTLASMTPATAPLLSALVGALRDLPVTHDAERQAVWQLAYVLEHRLLGTAQRVYGQRTTIPTTFDRDITLYTLLDVDPSLLPIAYDHIFSAVIRYMRQPRSRPLIVPIDELYIMTMIRSLEAWLIDGIKGGRNFETGFWLADQNIETFFNEQGQATHFGAFALGNSGVRLLFHLDGLAAELVERAFRGKVEAHHLQRIRALGVGEYVGLFDDEVRYAHFDLLPLETRYLNTGTGGGYGSTTDIARSGAAVRSVAA